MTVTAPRPFLLLLAGLLALAPPAAACPGDCDGDGAVAVNELLTGVNIALGSELLVRCHGLDTDGDATVGVSELLAAVNAALDGCGTPRPTATATATPPTTATPTATASATPGNRPPVTATPFVYRGSAGMPIALPLGVTDPEGGPLACAAEPLEPGMTLGADAVLRWTPSDTQRGPFTVPFTCTDGDEPPAGVSGALSLHVAAADACATPTCDPAGGCTFALPPADQRCCDGAVVQRVAEVTPECPHGRVLEIGRNLDGFGPLRNCDRLRLLVRAQANAELTFHIRVSCVNPLNRVTVSARLETTARGLTVDAESPVFLPVQAVDGYYERRNVRFPVLVPGPFFDLDDAEANLTVTVRDADGASVSRSVRLTLTTRGSVRDIPD